MEGGTRAQFEDTLVSNINVEAQRASAQVRVPRGGGFVVFATSYYDGWRALLDAQPVPIRIVNGATMGIQVPEGEYAVNFEFTDPGLRLGLFGTAFGIVSCVLLVIYGETRRRWRRAGFQGGCSSPL